jgi:hypothetical protein
MQQKKVRGCLANDTVETQGYMFLRLTACEPGPWISLKLATCDFLCHAEQPFAVGTKSCESVCSTEMMLERKSRPQVAGPDTAAYRRHCLGASA